MEKQVTPEAFFDSLSLAEKLGSFLDGFKLEEIHLFSYFSSFLYCYAGNAIATWPHQYIAFKGYPFSDTVNEAISRHIQNSLYIRDGEYYRLTSRGTEEYNNFKDQTLFAEREQMINAACTTSILIPYGETIRALLNEPDFQQATKAESKAFLDQTQFYPEFVKIINEIGVHTKDLLIPAVTWINLLLEKDKAK